MPLFSVISYIWCIFDEITISPVLRSTLMKLSLYYEVTQSFSRNGQKKYMALFLVRDGLSTTHFWSFTRLSRSNYIYVQFSMSVFYPLKTVQSIQCPFLSLYM